LIEQIHESYIDLKYIFNSDNDLEYLKAVKEQFNIKNECIILDSLFNKYSIDGTSKVVQLNEKSEIIYSKQLKDFDLVDFYRKFENVSNLYSFKDSTQLFGRVLIKKHNSTYFFIDHVEEKIISSDSSFNKINVEFDKSYINPFINSIVSDTDSYNKITNSLKLLKSISIPPIHIVNIDFNADTLLVLIETSLFLFDIRSELSNLILDRNYYLLKILNKKLITSSIINTNTQNLFVNGTNFFSYNKDNIIKIPSVDSFYLYSFKLKDSEYIYYNREKLINSFDALNQNYWVFCLEDNFLFVNGKLSSIYETKSKRSYQLINDSNINNSFITGFLKLADNKHYLITLANNDIKTNYLMKFALDNNKITVENKILFNNTRLKSNVIISNDCLIYIDKSYNLVKKHIKF